MDLQHRSAGGRTVPQLQIAPALFRVAVSHVFLLLILGLDAFLVARLVGAFYTLALVELGRRRVHNNFYWSGEVTLFILFFASVHFWLRYMGGRFDLSTRKSQIALFLWGLHIAGGIYWYIAQLLTTPVYNIW